MGFLPLEEFILHEMDFGSTYLTSVARSFWAAKSDFCMMRKNFLQPTNFSIFVKTHFFTQHLISKVFEKFMRWASKIFAW